jgi:hypothetical protein
LEKEQENKINIIPENCKSQNNKDLFVIAKIIITDKSLIEKAEKQARLKSNYTMNANESPHRKRETVSV